MKSVGKVAKTAHMSGKDWKREICVFSSNYRATPHTSTKECPYGLLMMRRVRTKIPEFIPYSVSEEVVSNDRKAKQKMKTYADKSRKTAGHEIKVGDTVLVRQRKRNKFSTPFESTPYMVEKIKGTMITASRITDNRKLTRNSFYFKRWNSSTLEDDQEVINNGQDQEWWDFHEDSEDVGEVETGGGELSSDDQLQPNLRRSGRATRRPTWTNDYVMSYS